MTDKALNLSEQAFLHTISQELEEGELRFPTSMEVTMRVLEALEQTRWNRSAAARQLGMTLRQLRYRLQKWDLE